jgi:hypothetical protein
MYVEYEYTEKEEGYISPSNGYEGYGIGKCLVISGE